MSDLAKKITIAVLIILIVAASFIYYNKYTAVSRTNASIITLDRHGADRPPVTETITSGDINQAIPDAGLFKAHVAGAVNAPGLYEAPDGSRVADLIELAGGASDDADLDRINLAAYVSDGQQIYVPRYADNEGIAGGTETVRGSLKLININTATASELSALPGIGDSLSQAIINYRDNNGAFNSIEDVMNVSGIGEKRFEQIKGLITVK